MATYNSMAALSSGATPIPDALGLNAGAQSLCMEVFDSDLNFDESLLDNVNGALPPLPFTPSYDFETFSTTFEDPFSYTAATRSYDAAVAAASVGDAEHFNGEGESSPQELDNKLLSFSTPIVKAAIACIDESSGDQQYAAAELGMTAELYGMFFVAEDVFGGDNNPPARPLELTCHRRNLWQCSGQITLPRHMSVVVGDEGRHVPIFDLAASITAIESIEGKPTEIISVPWKGASSSNSGNSNNPAVLGAGAGTGAGAGIGGDEIKAASVPPQIPLDLTSGQELDGNRVSVPVSWKRLQFKHATANNGRRKGLQQHYVVQINFLGKTESGEFIKIAEIQSGPVIVRGRSPRNFDSRKDVPLAGDKKAERRRNDTATSTTGPSLGGGVGSGGKADLTQNLQRYHSLGNVQQSGDWISAFAAQQQQHHQQVQQAQANQHHPSKKMTLSSPNPTTRPPVPPWSSASDNGILSAAAQHNTRHITHTPATRTQRSAPPTLPINLSLSEDERSPASHNNRSGSNDSIMHSPSQFNSKSREATGGTGASATHNQSHPSAASPLETADMLYEYFPLSLDDWMPPVDAIYRPHVVHHTVVPPEVKAQQIRSKTKRYFAAE